MQKLVEKVYRQHFNLAPSYSKTKQNQGVIGAAPKGTKEIDPPKVTGVEKMRKRIDQTSTLSCFAQAGAQGQNKIAGVVVPKTEKGK